MMQEDLYFLGGQIKFSRAHLWATTALKLTHFWHKLETLLQQASASCLAALEGKSLAALKALFECHRELQSLKRHPQLPYIPMNSFQKPFFSHIVSIKIEHTTYSKDWGLTWIILPRVPQAASA